MEYRFVAHPGKVSTHRPILIHPQLNRFFCSSCSPIMAPAVKRTPGDSPHRFADLSNRPAKPSPSSRSRPFSRPHSMIGRERVEGGILSRCQRIRNSQCACESLTGFSATPGGNNRVESRHGLFWRNCRQPIRIRLDRSPRLPCTHKAPIRKSELRRHAFFSGG